MGVEEAQKIIDDKNQQDIDFCVKELNELMSTSGQAILDKHQCIQTYTFSGQGDKIIIQPLILKK